MRKIMIVDNDAFVSTLLKINIQNLGYDVAGIAFSAIEAIDMAKILKPDLVLMDIRMPGELNGIGAAEIIKNEMNIPIIIMTAYPNDFDNELNSEKLKDIGLLGYIEKPIQAEELKKVIASAFYKIELEHQLRDSEDRYRTLFEKNPDPVFILDKEGTFIEGNNAALTFFDCSYETLLRKNLRDFLSPSNDIQFPEILTNPLKGSAMQKIEFYVRKKLKYMASSFTSTTWRGKDVVYGVGKDITCCKEVEEELRKSEELYRKLVKTSPDVIVITDLDGNIIEVSHRTLELYGIESKETLIGKNFLDFVAPENKKNARDILLEVMNEGSLRNSEIIVLREDGTRLLIEINASIINDSSGRPNEIICIARDITARREVENILRQESENAQKYLDIAGTMILIINRDQKIGLINKRGCEILESTEREIINKNWFDEYIPERIREEIKGVFLKFISGEGIEALKYYENPVLTKSSQEKIIAWYNTILRDDAGNHIGVLCSGDDITERKKTEEELKQAHRDLEKKVIERTADFIKVNKQLEEEIAFRKETEIRLNEMLKQVDLSNKEKISILNMLRMGTVMIDGEGYITFLNQTAKRLLGKDAKDLQNVHFQEFLPVKAEEMSLIMDMLKQSPDSREKVLISLKSSNGKYSRVEVEIQNDPQSRNRQILFLYDVSDLYDLRRMLDEKAQFHDLVGRTSSMQVVFQQIQDVSNVDWTVLIEGETGTGKELVARAIHSLSHRKNKPFITVNCAGLTESLLTSQLFGHKKGTFTGAIDDRIGLFEAANEGTIFLDEIGDISMTVQTSLLRVLEQKEITRVGESLTRKIDVRILTATHRDLMKEVEKGNFRSDLLYRIRVTRIKLPTLKERREDIPRLVVHFLGLSRAASGKDVHHISNEAMNILLEYNWPGNVRELRSTIEFAVTHCKKDTIEAEDIPREIIEEVNNTPISIDMHLDEKTRIVYALKKAKGNRKKAAELLNIGRATLYRHMSKFNIGQKESH